MSRKITSLFFALSLPFLSVAFIGCGSEGNTVIVDDRSEAEVQQEMEDYDKQMEQDASDNVTE